MSHRYRIRGAVAALVLTLVVSGASQLAAQAGAVTGVVADATSGQPLDGARIGIAGTRIGGLTDSEGRYLIRGVPPGVYTVRIVNTGYGTREQEISVTSGSTEVADFRLVVSAVDPDQRVATGAGRFERRMIGASLPALDFDRIAESFPVDGFGQALEGRIPGVRSSGTSGGIGAGRELRIRGTDSFEYSRQRPLVLIDGVRVDTEKLEWGGMVGVTCCRFSGGAGEDRLSDLNPEEIDRVEVLKGPAAAALFGVEGSAGVIQVFTKRGRTDSPPAFTLNSGFGFNRLRANLPTRLRPNFTGPHGFAAWDPNDHLIENGLVTNHDLTVSGGGRNATYFAAGGLTYEEGSVWPNHRTRANLRVNMNWSVADNLSVDVTSGFVRNRIRALQGGNNWLGVYTNAMLSDPFKATVEEPYGGGVNQEVSVADAQAVETTSEADRWTGRVQVSYSPLPNFTNRLMIGTDRVSDHKNRILPWGRYYTYLEDRGEKNIGTRHSRKFTLDFLSAYDYSDVVGLDFLSGSVSLGGQVHWDDVSTVMATGRGYDRPISTLVRAETTYADERMFEERGRGVFVMNRLNAWDDLFLTAALRVDGHSTFNDSFEPRVYPQAAFAYSVPRSVLPALISNLRVRAAQGTAGKPVFLGFRFDRYPPELDLEPEEKVEREAGLDLGLMNDRIGLELTWYHARVRNAVLLWTGVGSVDEREHRRDPDCCEITNRGIEAAVKAWLIDTPFLRWNVNLAYEWNRNRITDLGPSYRPDSIPLYEQRPDGTWEHVGWRQAHSLRKHMGESVGDIWDYAIAAYHPGINRHTATEHWFYRGVIHPTHMGSISSGLRIGGHVRLAFQLRGEMGAVMRNVGRAYGVRNHAYDEYLRHLDSDGSRTHEGDSVLDYHSLVIPIDKRDHIRLQAVSLAYDVPEGIAGLVGLKGTTVTLSGYNLHWWDDCNCPDPSQKYHASDFEATPFMGLPQPRRFLLSVRTRF